MDNASAGKKIVIIEDNADLAEIYKAKLELAGYTCFVATDGIAGLYHVQSEKPDLVLLDLMVPNIAGDQILAKMRSTDWGKHIPVYIVSNLNEEDAPKGLRDYGIAGYSVKSSLMNDDIEKIANSILRPNGDHPAQPLSLEHPPAPSVELPPVTQPQTPTSLSTPPGPPSPPPGPPIPPPAPSNM